MVGSACCGSSASFSCSSFPRDNVDFGLKELRRLLLGRKRCCGEVSAVVSGSGVVAAELREKERREEPREVPDVPEDLTRELDGVSEVLEDLVDELSDVGRNLRRKPDCEEVLPVEASVVVVVVWVVRESDELHPLEARVGRRPRDKLPPRKELDCLILVLSREVLGFSSSSGEVACALVGFGRPTRRLIGLTLSGLLKGTNLGRAVEETVGGSWGSSTAGVSSKRVPSSAVTSSNGAPSVRSVAGISPASV